MPDDQGRMTLLEMRENVWSNLAMLYYGFVDPTTGQPSNPRIDPTVDARAINRWLNEALTATFLDLSDNAEELFSDEETIDVVANTVEYQLPTDLAFFRSAWWKDASIDLTQAPPSCRKPMYLADDTDNNLSLRNTDPSVPSFRLQVDSMVLDIVPTSDNPGGILVRYVKWANYLATDDQIIESRFANIIQEIIVLQASVSAGGRRAFLDMSELRSDLAEWKNRLAIAARNYNMPQSVRLTTTAPVQLRGAAGGNRRRFFS